MEEREEEREGGGPSQWSFITLNIINFADVARRKKHGVLWDVRRVSSP